MTKSNDPKEKLEHQSGGGHVSGTKFGNQPGEKTQQGSQETGGEGDSKKAKSG